MNEEKFTGLAAVYSKFRPGYPADLLQYLHAEAGFAPGKTVADIGAGTGIFSKFLAEGNSPVICVEPNPGMLALAKQELALYPLCRFVQASAEHTTLPESSVNFVTVAQAFHWFNREAFRLECQRILKPGGRVVLVWNSREQRAAITVENAAVNRQYCPNFKGFSGGIQEDPAFYANFFKNGRCECKAIENNLLFTLENFIGRNLSSSYAPKQGSPQYKNYIKALEGLFNRYSKGGMLAVPNAAKSYMGAV
ncbi:MAG: class I SAM-dependent methyltransferase [Oscillospiraceae bacterium]